MLGLNVSQTHFKLQYAQHGANTFKLTMETKTDGVINFQTVSILRLTLKSDEVNILYNKESNIFVFELSRS